MDEYAKEALEEQKKLFDELENEICEIYEKYLQKGISIGTVIDLMIKLTQDIGVVYHRDCYLHLVGDITVKFHKGLRAKFDAFKLLDEKKEEEP